MRYRSSIFYFIFLFINLVVFANQKINFEQISTNKGLSQNNILCIFQDSIGYMWFGTHDGLNRYDGYEFKVYKNNPNDPNSIVGNVIQTIFEDSEGNLWIGTEGKGLSKFNRKSERFENYLPSSKQNSINHSIIKSILEDSKGNIWIATYGGGINILNKKTKNFEYLRYREEDENSLSSDTINVLFKDSQGNIWIGTEGKGLNQYIENENKIIRYPHLVSSSNKIDESYFLSGNTVNTIHEDHNNDLWIGTWDGGLNRFNKQTKSFTHYTKDNSELTTNTVRSISRDSMDNLWIATYDGGVLKYSFHYDNFVNYLHNPNEANSLGSNILWSILVDRSDIVWIGTWGNGLNRYVWRNNLFKHIKIPKLQNSKLSNDIVTSIIKDNDGYIWTGSLGGGLSKFKLENNELIHFENDPINMNSLPNNIVRCIYRDSKNRVWVGTDGGLALYKKDTNDFRMYKNKLLNNNSLSDDRVYAITEDSFGEIWIATWDGGVNRLNPETGNFTHYSTENSNLSTNKTWKLFEDSRGNIWIGTVNGLNLYNRETNSFQVFKSKPEDKNSISFDSISDIYEDKLGNLWIGTFGGGLNRLNRDDMTFEAFTTADGLSSDSITAIMEDRHSRLWLSTTNGIMQFNYELSLIDTYGLSDGLQNNEFIKGANFKDKNGNLYFGGVNGFNIVNPNNIRKNYYQPPIVLTSLKQDGHNLLKDNNLDKLDHLTLNWSNNYFEFNFSGLNFIQSNKNQYAYMLEGLDKQWNYVGSRRFGAYTNIPDGDFTLKIRAANNDGIWTDEALAIKITVLPPYWRKTWFRTFIFLLTLILLYLIYQYRVRSIKLAKKRLEEQVQIRSQKIIQKNKELEVIKNEIEQKNLELQLALNEVDKISKTDSLTAIPNRRCAREKIESEIAGYSIHNSPFSIIISDIDFFKKFNDTYGHEVGDIVLKNVASLIKSEIRKGDFCARWGGEEFLIILPNTTQEDALLFIERFRKKLENMICQTKENECLNVTMTFGITEYNPTVNIDENINRADQALYLGKENGRNCSMLYQICK